MSRSRWENSETPWSRVQPSRSSHCIKRLSLVIRATAWRSYSSSGSTCKRKCLGSLSLPKSWRLPWKQYHSARSSVMDKDWLCIWRLCLLGLVSFVTYYGRLAEDQKVLNMHCQFFKAFSPASNHPTVLPKTWQSQEKYIYAHPSSLSGRIDSFCWFWKQRCIASSLLWNTEMHCIFVTVEHHPISPLTAWAVELNSP